MVTTNTYDGGTIGGTRLPHIGVVTQNFPFRAISVDPTPPPVGYVNVYLYTSGLFTLQFNDAGTIRYKYLNMTNTSTTWSHSTSPHSGSTSKTTFDDLPIIGAPNCLYLEDIGAICPPNPPDGTILNFMHAEGYWYMQYNASGTIRYKRLPGGGGSAAFVHSTSPGLTPTVLEVNRSPNIGSIDVTETNGFDVLTLLSTAGNPPYGKLPDTPGAGGGLYFFLSNNRYFCTYTHDGTADRFKYLDLTGTGVTWATKVDSLP